MEKETLGLKLSAIAFLGMAILGIVFAILTLVFGALAVTSHDDHDEHTHTSGGEVAAVQQAE